MTTTIALVKRAAEQARVRSAGSNPTSRVRSAAARSKAAGAPKPPKRKSKPKPRTGAVAFVTASAAFWALASRHPDGFAVGFREARENHPDLFDAFREEQSFKGPQTILRSGPSMHRPTGAGQARPTREQATVDVPGCWCCQAFAVFPVLSTNCVHSLFLDLARPSFLSVPEQLAPNGDSFVEGGCGRGAHVGRVGEGLPDERSDTGVGAHALG